LDAAYNWIVGIFFVSSCFVQISRQKSHLAEDKSVLMVRVASGELVYNLPASMLVDEGKPK
jgi:hypothetical protein